MSQRVVHIRAAVRVVTCGIVLLTCSSQAMSDAGSSPAVHFLAEPVPGCLFEVQQEAEGMGISMQIVQASSPNGTLVDSAAAWWHEHPVDILVWLDGNDGHLVSRWQSYRRSRNTILEAKSSAHWPCSLANPLRSLLAGQHRHRLMLLTIAGVAAMICVPAMWVLAGFRRRRERQNST